MARCIDSFVTLNQSGSGLSQRGKALFLNGVNMAWINWALDFASAPTYGTHCRWADAMRFVRNNGGNSIRVWLFPEPHKALQWVGSSASLKPGVLQAVQTLLELCREPVKPSPRLYACDRCRDMVRPRYTPPPCVCALSASDYDVLVIPVLFNGALLRSRQDCAVVGDDAAMASVVANVVEPLARQVRGYARCVCRKLPASRRALTACHA